MNGKALACLEKGEGWELGAGATITILDAGNAASLGTTTVKDDIYAFLFGQKELMAWLGIQGGKVTRFTPS